MASLVAKAEIVAPPKPEPYFALPKDTQKATLPHLFCWRETGGDHGASKDVQEAALAPFGLPGEVLFGAIFRTIFEVHFWTSEGGGLPSQRGWFSP